MYAIGNIIINLWTISAFPCHVSLHQSLCLYLQRQEHSADLEKLCNLDENCPYVDLDQQRKKRIVSPIPQRLVYARLTMIPVWRIILQGSEGQRLQGHTPCELSKKGHFGKTDKLMKIMQPSKLLHYLSDGKTYVDLTKASSQLWFSNRVMSGIVIQKVFPLYLNNSHCAGTELRSNLISRGK